MQSNIKLLYVNTKHTVYIFILHNYDIHTIIYINTWCIVQHANLTLIILSGKILYFKWLINSFCDAFLLLAIIVNSFIKTLHRPQINILLWYNTPDHFNIYVISNVYFCTINVEQSAHKCWYITRKWLYGELAPIDINFSTYTIQEHNNIITTWIVRYFLLKSDT